jgi:hypothetical protein
MCKEILRKIPIFMLESVGKFHCGYWNVLEMSTVYGHTHVGKFCQPCCLVLRHPPYMLEFCLSPCNSVVNTVQCLPRAFETECGVLGAEDVSWRKICISAKLAQVRTPRTTQQLLAEFWTPVDCLPYSADLNPLDFAIWHVLQAKSLATLHANLDALRLLIAVEWDQLMAENIRKISHSFLCCRQAITKKN